MKNSELKDYLTQSLTLLAEKPPVQLKLLNALPIDEIALIAEDIEPFCHNLIENSPKNKNIRNVYEIVKIINQYFTFMTTNDDESFWEPEDLKRTEWNHIRFLAQKALENLSNSDFD
ncbi:MAG: hypothetical protein KG003_11790 [Bacteroidetes bacterium]|nr:hypothetical protein [Bacteroidota bacterium]